jgi:hypothetical protein
VILLIRHDDFLNLHTPHSSASSPLRTVHCGHTHMMTPCSSTTSMLADVERGTGAPPATLAITEL